LAQTSDLELPLSISAIPITARQIEENVPLQSLLGLINSILEILKNISIHKQQWHRLCQRLITSASALVASIDRILRSHLAESIKPFIDITSQIHAEITKQPSTPAWQKIFRRDEYAKRIDHLSTRLKAVAENFLFGASPVVHAQEHTHTSSPGSEIVPYKLPAKYDDDGVRLERPIIEPFTWDSNPKPPQLRILEQAEVVILQTSTKLSGFLSDASEAVIDRQRVVVKFYPELEGPTQGFHRHLSLLRQLQFGGKHVIYGYSSPNSPRPFLVFPSDSLSPSFGTSDPKLLEDQKSEPSSSNQEAPPASYDLTNKIIMPARRRLFMRDEFSDEYRGKLDNGQEGTQVVVIKVHVDIYAALLRRNDTRKDLNNKLSRRIKSFEMLVTLRHKNITQTLGYTMFDDLQVGSVIARYGNGALYWYIIQNPAADRHQLLLDVSQGLAYLHALDPPFVHGTLDPFVIFINDEGTAMIGSLDSAEASRAKGNESHAGHYWGDRRTTAPEVIDQATPSLASDIYSFAMIGLEVQSGKRPFFHLGSEGKLIMHVIQGRRPLKEDHPGVDDRLWALFEICWAQDPIARPTARHVVRELIQQTLDNIKRFQEYDLTSRVRKGSKLASGGYSIVYRGEMDGDGEEPKSMPVVLKELQAVGMSSEEEEDEGALKVRLYKRLYRELSFGLDLKHPNISRLLGFAIIGMPCLVSPYYEGRGLDHYIKKNPHADRWAMLIGVAKGLAYLHTHDPPIVHLDLKAANVLVNSQGDPAIAEFGTSKKLLRVPSALVTTSVELGTLCWRAPELVGGSSIDATIHADVYSFGCLVLEVMTGKIPFCEIAQDLHGLEVLMAILRGDKPSPKYYQELPAHSPLWALMRRCWDKDPSSRPSMEAVIQELEEMKPGSRA
ncbi:hypothetical protein FRB97_005451, partial [Tulasnella sp. 331]